MRMFYSLFQNHVLCGETPLPGKPLDALPDGGDVLWLFRRAPLAGRETFAVTHPAQFSSREGAETLAVLDDAPELPEELARAAARGRVRAVNREL